MKKQLVAAILVLASAVVLAPRTASASLPATACSSAALKVCAAVTASSVQVTAPVTTCTGHGNNQVCTTNNVTSWHLILHVWNLFGFSSSSGLSNSITYVGMGSQGYTGTGALVGAKFNGSSISTWQTANSINGNPVGALLDLAAQTKNGNTNALVGCGTSITQPPYATCYPSGPFLELDFLTSSFFDVNDPTAGYGWHAQAVNGTDCSIWVDSHGNQAFDSNAACTTTVTPEPMTMALLGTGLAGLGGTGLLGRFRRKKEDDLEA